MVEMKRLNLGCGKNIREGWVNADYVKFPGVDVRIDCNKLPYPFKDNEFDVIELKRLIEHLDSNIKVMEEMHRILKPGRKLIIEAPYQTGASAWCHPEHKRPYSISSFRYFLAKEKSVERAGLTYKVRFRRIKTKLIFPKGFKVYNHLLEPLFNSMQYIYENTILRYIFPADYIRAEMIK